MPYSTLSVMLKDVKQFGSNVVLHVKGSILTDVDLNNLASRYQVFPSRHSCHNMSEALEVQNKLINP